LVTPPVQGEPAPVPPEEEPLVPLLPVVEPALPLVAPPHAVLGDVQAWLWVSQYQPP